MSEARLDRIEAILAAIRTDLGSLRAEMATKADLAAVRSEMATKQELAALRSEMATKQELAALRSEMATKADLATLRVETKQELAVLRSEMATKADLEAAIAGVATNVEVGLIGRQLRELMGMKDDITVVSALAQRLDNTMVRLINDVLTEIRAEHSRMDRLLNRVRALEDAQPT